MIMNEELQIRAQKIAGSKAASAVYALTRVFLRIFLWSYLRVEVSGKENLYGKDALIMAPVHRSNLDSILLAPLHKRRMRALAKESLFKFRPFAWYLSALGGFPIRRGSADRESMKIAKTLLENGATLLVFPEGTRQEGNQIGELFDGTAYLAAKSGVPVVPIGICGTEKAMGSGSKFPKPYKVRICVGSPIPAPDKNSKRSSLGSWTQQLTLELQAVQDSAQMSA